MSRLEARPYRYLRFLRGLPVAATRGGSLLLSALLLLLAGGGLLPSGAGASPVISVTGPVRAVSSSAVFAQRGGTVLTGVQKIVSQYVPTAHYYVVHGEIINGQLSYDLRVHIAGASVVKIVQIGTNVAARTQLVAVGVPIPEAPASFVPPLMSPTDGSAVSPATCYPNKVSLQGITWIKEYIPGSYPASQTMATMIDNEIYYHNSAETAVNCQSANDQIGNNGEFVPVPGTHAFTYAISGSVAYVASDQHWQGTDLQNRCINIHLDGQEIDGYANGTYQQVTEPYEFICGTSTEPGDWFFDKTVYATYG